MAVVLAGDFGGVREWAGRRRCWDPLAADTGINDVRLGTIPPARTPRTSMG